MPLRSSIKAKGSVCCRAAPDRLAHLLTKLATPNVNFQQSVLRSGEISTHLK